MNVKSLMSLAGAALLASVISAQAATTLTVVGAECATDAPTTITGVTPKSLVCGTEADRMVSANANLGSPDGSFYSLGLAEDKSVDTGGTIAFEIAPAFAGSAMIFEVTNPSKHFEAAKVFVSTILDFATATFMGTVDNGDGGVNAPNSTVSITGGPWSYLWLVDYSRGYYGKTASVDGFDVDSIKLSPVPLPAGGLLLLGALGAFGFSRRRRA